VSGPLQEMFVVPRLVAMATMMHLSKSHHLSVSHTPMMPLGGRWRQSEHIPMNLMHGSAQARLMADREAAGKDNKGRNKKFGKGKK
jgi:hypothetical protein